MSALPALVLSTPSGSVSGSSSDGVLHRRCPIRRQLCTQSNSGEVSPSDACVNELGVSLELDFLYFRLRVQSGFSRP